MLFAVEGGGFFSSSASGYSKGLSLLLLGQKQEEESNKPMRVAPWNHYQLVDHEPDPAELQLASSKNRLSRGCASFVCFGGAAAGGGVDSPTSHLKVGPAKQQDHHHAVPEDALVVDEEKDLMTAEITEDDKILSKVSLRSSLKKCSNNVSTPVEGGSRQAGSNEQVSDIPDHGDRRKVQWTDDCGSELAHVREFEPSELGLSDDEYDNGRERKCSCTIM